MATQKRTGREPTGAWYHGIEVRLAASMDELMQCFTVRSAAFLGREGEPYTEEFDGNDISGAAHLLALADGVPVGTMRIRILHSANGGVATWQRFATIPQGRLAMKVLMATAEAARDYTRYKRVRRVVGEVADERLLRFWERFGFRRANRPTVWYNGVAYQPIEAWFDDPGVVDGDPSLSEAAAFYVWRTTDAAGAGAAQARAQAAQDAAFEVA